MPAFSTFNLGKVPVRAQSVCHIHSDWTSLFAEARNVKPEPIFWISLDTSARWRSLFRDHPRLTALPEAGFVLATWESG